MWGGSGLGTILHEAFGDDNTENNPGFVLSSMLWSSLQIPEVFQLLSSVHPLLVPKEDTDHEDIYHPVRPSHKSLPVFITGRAQRTNQRFRLSPSDHHTELLISCLELMNQEKCAMFRIRSPTLRSMICGKGPSNTSITLWSTGRSISTLLTRDRHTDSISPLSCTISWRRCFYSA